MIHTLKSDALMIEVNNIGAELNSLRTRDTEYLWQGNPAFWGSRAPVLFPIIGGLKNGAFTYEGKTYTLMKHGFVRNAYFHRIDPFGVTGQEGLTGESDEKLVFEYVDNPNTRSVYPFNFSFRVIYSLSYNTLNIAYQVQNQSSVAMYFSTGAHEAYRCPRHEDEVFDDYYIAFDQSGDYESYTVSKNGLLANDTYTVIQNGCILPLKHSLFKNDALIFKHIESKKLFIKSKKSPDVIEVQYDSPHLGIWTKVGAPFICIEPWCGLPDREDSEGILTGKEGIIKLDEGEAYTFRHAITIHEGDNK